ncbi:MAG: GIY-YIG nuclease family protein [Candidatus Omnitrophica bacterium]|nr:GIY-YIG nuclease family protein [Candidatus Omnitrophota bacterium]
MKKVSFRKNEFFVYIIECRDGTYYTGYTPDLENRLRAHNSGKGAKYTRSRRPVRLVWCREYKNFKKAVSEEARIKRLKRVQKEELVRRGIFLKK